MCFSRLDATCAILDTNVSNVKASDLLSNETVRASAFQLNERVVLVEIVLLCMMLSSFNLSNAKSNQPMNALQCTSPLQPNLPSPNATNYQGLAWLNHSGSTRTETLTRCRTRSQCSCRLPRFSHGPCPTATRHGVSTLKLSAHWNELDKVMHRKATCCRGTR